jgi:hypothetical protein
VAKKMSEGRQEEETECHRLARAKEWRALAARLTTPDGNKEAKSRDCHDKLIFHVEEIFMAPLFVLRAMEEANSEGWVAPYTYSIGSTTYPIFLAIGRTTTEALSYILEKHPAASKQQRKPGGAIALHLACEEGDDMAVKVLLAAFPGGSAVKSGWGNHNYPFIDGLCTLKTDTLQMLLMSHPKAGYEVLSDGNLPLHRVLSSNPVDACLIESIFYTDPSAVKIRGRRGWLPLHFACDAYPDKTPVPLSVFKMLLDEYPDGARAKDESGMLPLHILCANPSDDYIKVEFTAALLKQHPYGASEEDNSLMLPFDHLTSSERDLHATSFEDAWIQLIMIAPQSLLPRGDEASPFVTLACCLSKRLWENVATCCPRTLLSVDRDFGSALSNTLPHYDADGLGNPTAIMCIALETTFQCLRHVLGQWSRVPVAESIPLLHMIVYCGHLYLDATKLPLTFGHDLNEDDIEKKMLEPDANGNNTLHIACSAPCPPDAQQSANETPHSVVTEILRMNTETTRRKSVTACNTKGEIPLHKLLKNGNARACFFLEDIESILDKCVECASVWDPVSRMYPYMLPAAFNEGRGKAISVSATYELFHLFIVRRDITLFKADTPQSVP